MYILEATYTDNGEITQIEIQNRTNAMNTAYQLATMPHYSRVTVRASASTYRFIDLDKQ